MPVPNCAGNRGGDSSHGADGGGNCIEIRDSDPAHACLFPSPTHTHIIVLSKPFNDLTRNLQEKHFF